MKKFGAPIQTHSGLRIVLTNPYGRVPEHLRQWYLDRFGNDFHNGIDLILSGKAYQSYGTPMVALFDGMVPFVVKHSEFGERGNAILVQSHDRKWQTIHWHASKIFVEAGQEVKKGQILGTMGNSGKVMPAPTFSKPYNGTHVHFMLMKPNENGSEFEPVNPLDYIDLGDFTVGEDTGVEYDTAPLAWVVEHAEAQVRQLQAQIEALK